MFLHQASAFGYGGVGCRFAYVAKEVGPMQFGVEPLEYLAAVVVVGAGMSLAGEAADGGSVGG